ncbi:DUF6585 family protein [Glycomyces harbinensis]|uniref:Uncharacterized protein n=1 Tax=Glycomyces harbinensis TaxID=58114 RepID=A0A1G6Y0U2_9ACTN|nr:DUF6585 family protein [Glycomyces harbinensis]SDD83902.1 hypothetical protein SAMN05216270_10864 [Glycomyces harbinensis]
MTQHAAPNEFDDIAYQAGLGNWRAEYRPRPAPFVLPLTIAGAIYLITAACLAGTNMLQNSFGVIMLVIFTLFIGLGVLNVVHTKRKSGADDVLRLYDHGLIVKGPKTLVSIFWWDTARVHQRLFHYPQTGLTTYNYLLTGPEAHPIAIGDPKGAAASAIANLQGDLANFTLGAAFSRPEEWGPVIQQAVTRAQLPDVLARIDRGERLAFGDLVIDRNALTIDGAAIAWNRLQAVSLRDGVALFKSADRLFRTREPVYTIPNFFVLQEAVRARTGLEWT